MSLKIVPSSYALVLKLLGVISIFLVCGIVQEVYEIDTLSVFKMNTKVQMGFY